MSEAVGRVDFAKRRKTIAVELPELGTQHLKALSVKDVIAIAKLEVDGIPGSIKELFFAMVDPDGNRIYTTEEDLANLAEMSIETAGPLYDALEKLNGTSKAITEQVAKNSEASLSTASASA